MTLATAGNMVVRKALLARIAKPAVATNSVEELCWFGDFPDHIVPSSDEGAVDSHIARIADVKVVMNMSLLAHTFDHSVRSSTPTILSLGFGEVEVLRSDDSDIKNALRYLRNDAQIRDRIRLANRVDELLEAFREEEGGRVFSVDSLRGLISFLETNPALKLPSVTITPNGEFYASWKQGPDRIFSVQFLNSHSVRYVVFAPSAEHVGRTDRASGSTSADSVMRSIAHFNVLAWAGV